MIKQIGNMMQYVSKGMVTNIVYMNKYKTQAFKQS